MFGKKGVNAPDITKGLAVMGRVTDTAERKFESLVYKIERAQLKHDREEFER